MRKFLQAHHFLLTGAAPDSLSPPDLQTQIPFGPASQIQLTTLTGVYGPYLVPAWNLPPVGDSTNSLPLYSTPSWGINNGYLWNQAR